MSIGGDYSDNRKDGDLLAAYAHHGDQAAFAQVVGRHSALVLDVCRRQVTGTADAEDAAQAVFLTLARKAAGLRRYASVAGWLHKVSWHIGRRAAAASLARQRREREVARMNKMKQTTVEAAPLGEALHAALAKGHA